MLVILRLIGWTGGLTSRPPHHRTSGSASGGSWKQHSFSATLARDRLRRSASTPARVQLWSYCLPSSALPGLWVRPVSSLPARCSRYYGLGWLLRPHDDPLGPPRPPLPECLEHRSPWVRTWTLAAQPDHLSPELNTGLRCVVPACPFRQPYMVFLFVGSSALTGGFLPTEPRDSAVASV